MPATKISSPITVKQYALPAVGATVVPATASTSSTPFGYAQAQADAIVTTINKLVTDVTDLKQVLKTLLDELNARNEI